MLKGKTAVVTGSSSGIGLGIAEHFSRAGANVVMNGIEKPEDVADDVARLDGLGEGKVGFQVVSIHRHQGPECADDALR